MSQKCFYTDYTYSQDVDEFCDTYLTELTRICFDASSAKMMPRKQNY